MSLFTYGDLVRIHTSVTPARAPGRASRELIQILQLLVDLSNDAIDAAQLATQLGPLTIPRDLIIDLWQIIFRFTTGLGLSAAEIVENLIAEGVSSDASRN